MAGDLGRDRAGRVAEVLLDDLRVRAGGEQEARGRVPHRVQVDVAEADALGQGLEPSEYVAWFQRSADLGGEREIVVPPRIAAAPQRTRSGNPGP